MLLHMEEIETTVRLRNYDMERINLKPVGPYLSLEVQGLAEKRPSLIIGFFSYSFILNFCNQINKKKF